MEALERLLRRATPAARRAADPLRRAAAARLRILRGPLRRVPSTIWIGGTVLVLVGIAFAATVLPLLTSGGEQPRAEVTGRFPDRLQAGHPVVVALAVDNTSASIISPLCLVARTDPSGVVDVTQAEFQGLNTVAFQGGRSCGGDLSGQETITVLLTLVPRHAGTVRVSLAAGERSRYIGRELSGSIAVDG